jgi:hypothetical protein
MATIKSQKPPATVYEDTITNKKPWNKFSPWRCIVWCDVGVDGIPIYDRTRDEFDAYWIKIGSLVWTPKGTAFRPDEPQSLPSPYMVTLI